VLESMAEEPQQQRDDRAARKQQLNGQIRAGVAGDLNQCVHDAVPPVIERETHVASTTSTVGTSTAAKTLQSRIISIVL
jgi:hypothetical protein